MLSAEHVVVERPPRDEVETDGSPRASISNSELPADARGCANDENVLVDQLAAARLLPLLPLPAEQDTGGDNDEQRAASFNADTALQAGCRAEHDSPQEDQQQGDS